jgi:hypothetical protein
VGCERELQPRGVRGEGVEREVSGAGLLERLDTILDFGVLAVGGLQGSAMVDRALTAKSAGVAHA